MRRNREACGVPPNVNVCAAHLPRLPIVCALQQHRAVRCARLPIVLDNAHRTVRCALSRTKSQIHVCTLTLISVALWPREQRGQRTPEESSSRRVRDLAPLVCHIDIVFRGRASIVASTRPEPPAVYCCRNSRSQSCLLAAARDRRGAVTDRLDRIMDAAGTRSKLDRCSVAGASASRRGLSCPS